MSNPKLKYTFLCEKGNKAEKNTSEIYSIFFFGLHTLSISLDSRHCQVKPAVEFLFLFATPRG